MGLIHHDDETGDRAVSKPPVMLSAAVGVRATDRGRVEYINAGMTAGRL